MPWKEEKSREYLLAMRIWQLKRQHEDIKIAIEGLKVVRSRKRIDLTRNIVFDQGKLKEARFLCMMLDSIINIALSENLQNDGLGHRF